MSSNLYKTTSISYVPGTPGVPYFPGQAFIPKHTAWQTQHVCGFEPTVPGHWVWVQSGSSSANAGFVRVFVPDTPTTDHVGLAYVCHDELVPVMVPQQDYIPPRPGIPATYAQTLTDYNLGWNSSAQSIKFFERDGYVRFTVPDSTIGVIIGLNDARDPRAFSFNDVDHAFFVARGIARIYERGVERHYIGAVAAAQLEIRRVAGVVTYSVGGTLAYTSTAPSTSTVFLEAWMYSGGDVVASPSIVALSSADAVLQPIGAVGGNVAFAQAALALQPLAASAGITAKTALALQPLQIFTGDHPYGSARLTLSTFAVDGEAAPLVPPYAIGGMTLGLMTVASSGLTGEVGGANLAAQPLFVLSADHAYGQASLSLHPFGMYSSACEGETQATLGTGLAVDASGDSAIDLAVVMTSSGDVATVIAVTVLADAGMTTSASVATTAALEAILLASMSSDVTISGMAPSLTDSSTVWVVNLDSNGTSMYEEFPFNSYGHLNGSYLGLTSSGLYDLSGSTDDGATIRASVNFGKTDMDNGALKRVPECFLGVSSTGVLCLKVTVGADSYIYTANRSNENLAVQRVEIGKGLRASYFEFELFNKDGCDFELDTIDFRYVETSRRI